MVVIHAFKALSFAKRFVQSELCNGHHEGDMETGKVAIPLDKALWVDTYGPDTDYLAITQDAVARLRGKT